MLSERRSWVVLFVLLGLVQLGSAQEAVKDAPAKPAKRENKEAAGKPELAKETLAKSRHSITLADGKLDYEATAGTMLLKDDDGKAKASVFFVAYTKSGDVPASKRPLAFAFNGGPGSSA